MLLDQFGNPIQPPAPKGRRNKLTDWLSALASIALVALGIIGAYYVKEELATLSKQVKEATTTNNLMSDQFLHQRTTDSLNRQEDTKRLGYQITRDSLQLLALHKQNDLLSSLAKEANTSNQLSAPLSSPRVQINNSFDTILSTNNTSYLKLEYYCGVIDTTLPTPTIFGRINGHIDPKYINNGTDVMIYLGSLVFITFSNSPFSQFEPSEKDFASIYRTKKSTGLLFISKKAETAHNGAFNPGSEFSDMFAIGHHFEDEFAPDYDIKKNNSSRQVEFYCSRLFEYLELHIVLFYSDRHNGLTEVRLQQKLTSTIKDNTTSEGSKRSYRMLRLRYGPTFEQTFFITHNLKSLENLLRAFDGEGRKNYATHSAIKLFQEMKGLATGQRKAP